MLKFNELKQIHLEITNNCQASCPMCSRNQHGGIDNPLIKITSWTFDEFKQIITQEVLDQVDHIYFCGNFGDPLLNDDLVKMCQYIKDNSDIHVRIHTNGSLRNTKWWESLAKALPENHVVIFALDGLEDTHSRYRIGTDYNKIIQNAQAFINAGGIAEWVYIVFEHNEHQVEIARQRATDLGFSQFIVKNSSRFVGEPNFPVYDKSGNTIDVLRPSSNTVIKFLDNKVLQNYKEVVKNTEIDCFVKKAQEIYIDAHKNLMPCCFLASTPYNYSAPGTMVYDIRKEILEQYNQLVNDLKVIHTLDKSIKDIVDSIEYQTVWDEYWTTKKLITCVRACGKNQLSKPNDQFIEKDKLK